MEGCKINLVGCSGWIMIIQYPTFNQLTNIKLLKIERMVAIGILNTSDIHMLKDTSNVFTQTRHNGGN